MKKGSHHTKEARHKMSLAHLGKKRTEETKKKIGRGNKGKVRSEELRRRISRKMTGRKLTKEHCKNMSRALMGRIVSEETRRKIGLAMLGNKHCLGNKHTEEAKRKIGEANTGEKNGMYGKHHTEEFKRQRSEAWTGENNPNYGRVFSVEERKNLSTKAKKRYNDPVWMMNMITSYRNHLPTTESKKHRKLKLICKNYLLELGLQVTMEHPIYIGRKLYMIDVAGFGAKEVAIECGNCTKQKLDVLSKAFDLVVHVPYNTNVCDVLHDMLGEIT